MKKITARLIIFMTCFTLLLVCGTLGTINARASSQPEESKNYPDIVGHWAEKSIDMLISKGYVKGIEVNGRMEIQPDKTITRAEFITILSRCRQFELLQEKVKQFGDVKTNAWFKNDLDRLSSNSIVNGSADGSFRPDSPVTRAEIAALICRAYGWETLENISSISMLGKFTDIGSDTWYYESVMIDKLKNAINGNPDGTFAPMRNATRAEAITILCNVINGEDSTGPSPSATIGVQPTPSPAVQPTPSPEVQHTPIATPVYNPSGIIAYDMKAEPGKTVYYQIYSFGMKELGKFKIKVNYDPAFAKAVDVIKGSVKTGNYIGGAGDIDLSTADQGYITVSSQDNSTNANESGTIFTVVLEIQANASGSTDVTLTGGASDEPEIYDTEGNSIQPLSVKNGSITIKE